MAFQSGDIPAFDQLVRRWDRKIQGVIYRIVGTDDEARDLSQEAFLKAYRALGTFKQEARFSSWLYQIAINAAATGCAAAGGGPTLSLDELEESGGDRAARRGPERARPDRIARPVARRGRARWRRCPRSSARSSILKEYQGLTFPEIAETLDVPLSTVKTRLYRGLGQLRVRLEHDRASAARPPYRLPAPEGARRRDGVRRVFGTTCWTCSTARRARPRRGASRPTRPRCAACRDEMAALRRLRRDLAHVERCPSGSAPVRAAPLGRAACPWPRRGRRRWSWAPRPVSPFRRRAPLRRGRLLAARWAGRRRSRAARRAGAAPPRGDRRPCARSSRPPRPDDRRAPRGRWPSMIHESEARQDEARLASLRVAPAAGRDPAALRPGAHERGPFVPRRARPACRRRARPSWWAICSRPRRRSRSGRP